MGRMRRQWIFWIGANPTSSVDSRSGSSNLSTAFGRRFRLGAAASISLSRAPTTGGGVAAATRPYLAAWPASGGGAARAGSSGLSADPAAYEVGIAKPGFRPPRPRLACPVRLGRELVNTAWDGLPESALHQQAVVTRDGWHFRQVP